MRKSNVIGPVLIGLTLAACSPRAPGNDVDIGSAAQAAKRSSDSYALTRPAAVRKPAAGATPSSRAQTSQASTTDKRPVSLSPDTPQAAATAVQSYFALIEQGNYREAWKAWDRDGAASGMSQHAFVASFEKYADYHADVGTPGRIDSGAGQRYVDVPVKAYGTLRSGKPFAMEGSVSLHRVADVDGATADQRRWRIADSGLRPRPALKKSSKHTGML